MMASLSFWGMSPCIELTVKLASRIFSVSQSTLRFVLQKMTAWVMRVLGQGNMPALAPRLGELQVPIMLLTGALDERYTQLAEQLQRQYPAIQHHIVADAGHNLVMEAPERVRELLSELASYGDGGTRQLPA